MSNMLKEARLIKPIYRVETFKGGEVKVLMKLGREFITVTCNCCDFPCGLLASIFLEGVKLEIWSRYQTESHQEDQYEILPWSNQRDGLKSIILAKIMAENNKIGWEFIPLKESIEISDVSNKDNEKSLLEKIFKLENIPEEDEKSD
tara:strand:+ start:646 stop:1086 length:441 start_codon:yes stop_codon:yes gene_type:complete